jgi:hypothetical protein
MISQDMLQAFNEALLKEAAAPPAAAAAKMSGKMKALLGLTAAGGVGAGIVGEQAKDDLVQGRTSRKQMSQSQGLSHYLT